MNRLGFKNLMAYLDEFFLVGFWKGIWESLVTLIQVLQNLGFYIHWGKLILPAQQVKFLGFILNSVSMTVTVPPSRMQEAHHLVQQAMVAGWMPLKLWERLIGKLNFMARAIFGGRTFLRRLIDLVVLIKHHHYKGAKVSKSALADLLCWKTFMDHWNGKALILDGQVISHRELTSDASSFAVGAVLGTKVIFMELTPAQREWHINIKDLFAFLVSFSLFSWQFGSGVQGSNANISNLFRESAPA